MSSGSGLWPGAAPIALGPGAVEVELTIRLGQAEISIGELTTLSAGQVIELDRYVDDPVDILLNGHVIARGEVVVEDDGPVVVITEVGGA